MARKPKAKRNGGTTAAVPPSRAKSIEITGKRVSGVYERGSIITIGKDIDQDHADLLVEKGLAVPSPSGVAAEHLAHPVPVILKTTKDTAEVEDLPKFLTSEKNGQRSL